MRESIYYYGAIFVIALIAAYFRWSYIGLGVFLGIVFAIAYSVTTRGNDPPLILGISVLLIGVVGLVITSYVAKTYGMSFEELYSARWQGKLGRRLPLYTVTALTTGILLIIYTLLGKLSERYE